MKFPPGYVPGVGLQQPTISTFGERLMKQMGWSEGQGLGKHEDGIKEAIRVKKKDDNKGVRARVQTSRGWFVVGCQLAVY